MFPNHLVYLIKNFQKFQWVFTFLPYQLTPTLKALVLHPRIGGGIYSHGHGVCQYPLLFFLVKKNKFSIPYLKLNKIVLVIVTPCDHITFFLLITLQVWLSSIIQLDQAPLILSVLFCHPILFNNNIRILFLKQTLSFTYSKLRFIRIILKQVKIRSQFYTLAWTAFILIDSDVDFYERGFNCTSIFFFFSFHNITLTTKQQEQKQDLLR